jgi:2-polyprenyl-3-methyl-5-hydroxy-6-metoxy-1,4-benzoquinol methylase
MRNQDCCLSSDIPISFDRRFALVRYSKQTDAERLSDLKYLIPMTPQTENPYMLTTQEYWNSLWNSESRVPDAFSSSGNILNRAYRAEMHEFYVRQLASCKEKRIFEIGCGRSQLLPYFAMEHHFEVSGIDYTEAGCTAARAILDKYKISGEILNRDLWHPWSDDRTFSGVVLSCGVVEHFEDTAGVIEAMAKWGDAQSEMITMIPNMRGTVGTFQKWLAPDLFAIHVPLSKGALEIAHTKAGLDVVDSGYLCVAHYGVCGLGGNAHSSIRKVILLSLIAASTVAQFIDRWVKLPRSELFSPYIYVRARKPTQAIS